MSGKKQVVKMVKRTVELPDKLPCGCGIEALRRFMGDTTRCKCGKVWELGLLEKMEEPKFKVGDSVRLRGADRLHPGRVGVVKAVYRASPGSRHAYLVRHSMAAAFATLRYYEDEFEAAS